MVILNIVKRGPTYESKRIGGKERERKSTRNTRDRTDVGRAYFERSMAVDPPQQA